MLYKFSLIKSYLTTYSGLTKSCWKGIIVSFFETTFVGVCFFLSLYFVNNLNFSVATAGFIISFYGLGRIFGGVIGGKLSDILSSHVISIIGLFIQAISFFILIYVKNKFFISFDLFILGFATYGFVTANSLWTLDQCGQNEPARLKAVNLLYMGSNLGIGLSAVLINQLSPLGFHFIFALVAIMLMALACYLWIQKNTVATTKQENSLIKSISEQSKNNNLIYLVFICFFLVGIVVAQNTVTYLIYLHDHFPTLGIKGISLLFALNPFLIALFQSSMAVWFNNEKKILTIGLGALLMGLGMFLLIIHSIGVVIFSCILYTVGEMIFFPIAQLLCYELVKEKNKGASVGLSRTIYAASVTVGPAFGGFLYHYLNGNAMWYVCGTIGLVCFFSCFFYR